VETAAGPVFAECAGMAANVYVRVCGGVWGGK